MDSILTTIKKMLGIDVTFEAFDPDLIVHINTILMTLNQMGIGPKDCFYITGPDEKWSDFTDGSTKIEAIKTYIYLRVKVLFDPPSSTSVLEAFNNQAKEFEWRLYVLFNY